MTRHIEIVGSPFRFEVHELGTEEMVWGVMYHLAKEFGGQAGLYRDRRLVARTMHPSFMGLQRPKVDPERDA